MKSKTSINIHGLIISALFTALIVIGSFIKIPAPVVPFTLQFLFTNLAGLLLGKKFGSLSVGVYIVTGLLGIPVFTSGGGIGYIFSPTFGYLIGFFAGTYAAGKIVEDSKNKDVKTMLVASFVNLVIVYAFGMVYYYFIANFYLGTPLGVGTLFIYCFVLVVPGDILLCFLAAILAKRVRPILNRRRI